MWSSKEHINSTIIVLLFLLAINFLHLGQLFLPLICLIILIDNKGKFHVNNALTFVILCLFGITFFLFSFRTGFYSTMGLCLPMAYYIGSNIKKHDEESIKNSIYLFAFAMACHIVLNFIFEICVDGADLFNSISHYDVWTGSYIPTTSIATNYILLISLFYYLLIHEKNKKIKITGLLLFVILVIYDIALGRRTPLLLSLLCFVLALLVDILIVKNNKINKKSIVTVFGVFAFVLISLCLIYAFDIFGAKELIVNLGIIKKLSEYGLDTGRLDIFIEAIKLVPQHLWGNQEIHDILGIQIHDLWFDTFDYAGIIPFILLVVHSIMFVSTFSKILKHPNISKDFKLFILILFIAITIQLFLEPIMSGSSLFIIIVVIIEAILENKLVYENSK